MQKITGALSAAALLGAACALFGAQPAEACGGLFCSTNPVDQNAERILFEVGTTGRITATVEITYTGDPREFSWIVPVPEVPDQMDVAPASSLRLLDQATAPIIIPPPTTCTQSTGDFFRGGGFDDANGFPAPAAEADGGGVTVTDLPVVGPFDPEVVEGTNAQELITWLDENGYTITEEMHPFIEEYVQQGYKFLGVKLTPESGTQDISPLVFSCPQGAPLVPLKLTAVASEPEMGILVFIAGASRYEPLNFRGITVDTDLVQFDPIRFQSNYYPLVSWLIDEEGGKAFITEFAGDSASVDVNNVNLFTQDIEESRQWAEDLKARSPYLTRMYSRMSGWEMDDDPVFMATEGANVDNTHDLSNRPPIEVCSGIVDPVPCGNTYCGVGSECAISENGQAGCVCSGGSTARAITVPVGRGQPLGQSVFCQDTELNMLQSLEGQLDVCGGFDCGAGGSCLPVNGFPTCGCDEGFVAVNDFSRQSGVRCEPVGERFQPEQLLWPEFAGNNSCACVTSDSKLPALGGLALLAGLGGMFGRRRNRNRRA